MDRARWVIHLDQRITRRKLFHLCVDPLGNTRVHSRELTECLEFLDAEGVEVYYLQPYRSDAPLIQCRIAQKEDLD